MFRSSEIRQCDVEVIVTNKLVLKVRVSNTIIIWRPTWGSELLHEYDDHVDGRKKGKINTIASDP